MIGTDGTDDRYSQLQDFEAEIGRSVAVNRVYYGWTQQFPTPYEYWLRDHGQIPILSWQSTSNGVPLATWADIAAGNEDSLIDARAADLMAYGAPLFFTFQHEPENDPDAGTPSDFIAAWRHIHDRLQQDGVTNVSYLLILMASTFRQGQADQWYPGDGYVDLIGTDGYNWYGCPGRTDPWMSFTDIFSDFYNYGIAKGKPMIIAEWGSTEDSATPGRKGQWVTDAESQLKQWLQIKAVSWFNNGPPLGVCNWWVDTSQSSLDAFSAMGADPYLNAPPPLITISSGPSDPSNSNQASFVWTSNIPGSTFACQVDTQAAQSCSSPFTFANLLDGAHSATITATDPASGMSNRYVSTWTSDTTPPVLTLGAYPKSITNQTDAHFQLLTSEPSPNASFSCTLDGGQVPSCGPWADYYSLADGQHTFTAVAYDDAGNVSAPVSYTWTIDTVPPTVTITSGPASLSPSKSVTFTFISNEQGVTFFCTKDGGSPTSCTSPKTYTVSDGAHTLTLTASDAAGNGSTAIQWSWTVDSTKPAISILSGPPNPSNTNTAGFTFSVSDASTTTSTCQIDSQTPTSCGPGAGGYLTDQFTRTQSNGWGNLNGGKPWKLPADTPDFSVDGSAGSIYLPLENHPEIAYIGQSWGDTDELVRFSVDGVPPTQRVLAQVIGRYNSTTAAFYSVRASIVWDGSLRLGATKKPDTGFEAQLGNEITFPGLGLAHTWFWVRASFHNEGIGVRILGKVWQDGTPEPSGWQYSYLDTSSPLTTAGKPGLRAQNWPTSIVPTVSFDDYTAQAGLVYTGLADGTHTETITSTDAAGNVGSAKWTWTVDTTPPTVTLVGEPNDPTSSSSATFKFSSSETGTTFACSLDGAAAATCTAPITYGGLSAGTHSFVVTGTDRAGNVSVPVSYSWTISLQAPTVTITSGPTSPTNQRSATFTFSASDPSSTFKCSIDGSTYTSCSSPKTYSWLNEGSHSFVVQATDTAGNTGTSSPWTWTIDLTKPMVTITSGPSDPTSQTTATFTWIASEPNVTFTCTLDSGAPTTCSSPITYSGLSKIRHTFSVYGTDAAGNKGASAVYKWTVQ